MLAYACELHIILREAFQMEKNYREVDLKIQRQTFLFTNCLTPLPLVLITISPT
jgi:hypothetical protein